MYKRQRRHPNATAFPKYTQKGLYGFQFLSQGAARGQCRNGGIDDSTLVAEALGQRAGALPRNIHELGIARDLFQHGQEPLRLGEQAAV